MTIKNETNINVKKCSIKNSFDSYDCRSVPIEHVFTLNGFCQLYHFDQLYDLTQFSRSLNSFKYLLRV